MSFTKPFNGIHMNATSVVKPQSRIFHKLLAVTRQFHNELETMELMEHR